MARPQGLLAAVQLALHALRVCGPPSLRSDVPPRVARRSNPFQGASSLRALDKETRFAGCIDMARPKGFEPLTSASGGQRSIQLSYGRVGRHSLHAGG